MVRTRCGGSEAEPEGESLELPVGLWSSSHVWAEDLGEEGIRSQAEAAELRFYNRVVGFRRLEGAHGGAAGRIG